MPHPMSDIVIVDDNTTILSVLGELFCERGYSVRTACDGLVALEEIRKRMPDVLLSDLDMPRMSGFELLSIVRRRYPAIAVIAMSADYSGLVVPPDIAADAFYAKGASSISRLFEILLTINDEEIRQSMRVPIPFSLTNLPHHQKGRATGSIACPDCSRVFSLLFRRSVLNGHEQLCPHCFAPCNRPSQGNLSDASAD